MELTRAGQPSRFLQTSIKERLISVYELETWAFSRGERRTWGGVLDLEHYPITRLLKEAMSGCKISQQITIR